MNAVGYLRIEMNIDFNAVDFLKKYAKIQSYVTLAVRVSLIKLYSCNPSVCSRRSFCIFNIFDLNSSVTRKKTMVGRASV